MKKLGETFFFNTANRKCFAKKGYAEAFEACFSQLPYFVINISPVQLI